MAIHIVILKEVRRNWILTSSLGNTCKGQIFTISSCYQWLFGWTFAWLRDGIAEYCLARWTVLILVMVVIKQSTNKATNQFHNQALSACTSSLEIFENIHISISLQSIQLRVNTDERSWATNTITNNKRGGEGGEIWNLVVMYTVSYNSSQGNLELISHSRFHLLSTSGKEL